MNCQSRFDKTKNPVFKKKTCQNKINSFLSLGALSTQPFTLACHRSYNGNELRSGNYV